MSDNYIVINIKKSLRAIILEEGKERVIHQLLCIVLTKERWI
mgnify:CR=1 FL=1